MHGLHIGSSERIRSTRLPFRVNYRTALGWTFALFSTARVFAYLPTLWVIHAQADSTQHSLLTWVTWLGANATMAAWLFEENGGRWSKPILLNGCNAAMCLAIAATILAYRI
jgi:hypothetical protein